MHTLNHDDFVERMMERHSETLMHTHEKIRPQKIQTGYYTGKTQLAKVKQQCVCKDNSERFTYLFFHQKKVGRKKRERREKVGSRKVKNGCVCVCVSVCVCVCVCV